MSILHVLITLVCSVTCALTVAFCAPEEQEFTRGTYSWNETRAEENISLPCKYGGRGGVMQFARRECNERGIWNDTILDDCLTFVTSSLENITKVWNNNYITSYNSETAAYRYTYYQGNLYLSLLGIVCTFLFVNYCVHTVVEYV